ncbi:MAG: oligopeptidase A, partial [Gammaproteobacteria bacterium]|nr:oligopeptidase A [Gammaproteobacteria bacterium]
MDIPTNPLLAATELPAFSRIQPAHVLPAVEQLIAGFRTEIERLVGDADARSFQRLMAPMEQQEELLNRAFSPVSHLHGVKDSPALREAYEAAIEKLTEHATWLGQNRV